MPGSLCWLHHSLFIRFKMGWPDAYVHNTYSERPLLAKKLASWADKTTSPTESERSRSFALNSARMRLDSHTVGEEQPVTSERSGRSTFEQRRNRRLGAWSAGQMMN